MGLFCAVPLPPYWDSATKPDLPSPRPPVQPLSPPEWWSSNAASFAQQFSAFLGWAAGVNADDLRQRAAGLLAGTPFTSLANPETWSSSIEKVQRRYSDAVSEWRATYDSLLDGWRQADDSSGNARRQANALRYQAMAFHEMTVIRNDDQRPDFAGLKGVVARYQEDGELLVINSGSGGRGFAVCLNCGYSESELAIFKRGPEELPKSYEHHAPLQFAPTRNSRAWVDCRKKNGPHDLRRQLLTARQVTDIAVIDIPQLVNADLAVATTLAHAFRLAGAQLLSLDSRELGSFVMPTDSGPHCGLVLFDSMPGGAGHVAELLELARGWIDCLTNILFINEAHHQRCITACLDCLLSYETQFDHDAGLLARSAAWSFWNALRNGHESPGISNTPRLNDPAPPPPTTNDMRLENARRKRRT